MLTAVSSSDSSMSRPTPVRCASQSPASSAAIDAEPLGQVAAQVVVDGVGDAGEVAQHRAALGVLEVERDRLLAAVERLEVQRVVLARVGADLARDVAADAGVLDLDDLGAEVGEELGAEGAGAELRHGEDAKTVERRAGHAG